VVVPEIVIANVLQSAVDRITVVMLRLEVVLRINAVEIMRQLELESAEIRHVSTIDLNEMSLRCSIRVRSSVELHDQRRE